MMVVSSRQSRDCCKTTEEEEEEGLMRVSSSVVGTRASSSSSSVAAAVVSSASNNDNRNNSNSSSNNNKMMMKTKRIIKKKKKKKKFIKPWMIFLFLTIIPTIISFRMMFLFEQEDSSSSLTASTTTLDDNNNKNNNNNNIKESILQTCGYYGHNINMYLSTKEEKKCQQRQSEWLNQLTIENHIYNIMIQKAIKRSLKDEYNFHFPNRWKLQFQNQYDTIKNLLLSSLVVVDNDTTNTTTNTTITIDQQQQFSDNSFPDISIMDFPKAGTSHLYKLLLSHPNTLPIYKRKEFCMDHGHFLDYTKFQNQNNISLMDLKTKLYKYHKHVLHKRNINNNTVVVDYDANSSKKKKKKFGDDEKTSSTKKQPPVLFVNACLQMDELMYHFAYMNIMTTTKNNNNNNNNNYVSKTNNKSKFIILFRDPADWLWASWNYWIDKNLDMNKPIDHDWATFGLHYRSPELFHELILSQGLTKTSGMRFTKQRISTVINPRQLLFLVSNDNDNDNDDDDRRNRIMFIKSEDMKNQNLNNNNVDNNNKFLNDLSIFTGLSKENFNMDIANSLTNCNSQKGYNENCGSSISNIGNENNNNLTTTTTTTTRRSQQQQSTSSGSGSGSGGYPITYHRPMLDVTRQLIYIQFWEECKIWSKEFGIVYQQCLDAVPTTTTTTTKV